MGDGKTGMFQDAASHLTGDGGETFEKSLKCVVVFEVIEQRLHRHAGTAENRRAAENVRVHGDHVV